MHRLIFEHIIKILILEARSHNRKVRDIVATLDKEKLITPTKDIRRIYYKPSNGKFDKKVAAEEVAELIQAKYPNKIKGVIEPIEPNSPGSLSSQFYTLKFNFDGQDVYLVVASGIIAGKEGELQQATNINNELNGKTVNLHVEGLKDSILVDGFRRVGGNLKADFAFTYNGKDVLFIQHKSPTHQQMSGTAKFDANNYPELNLFIKKVKNIVGSSPEGRLQSPVYTPIKDTEFAIEAVYGAQGKGPNGVRVYAVGDLKLEGNGNNRTLVAQKIYTYSTLPTMENTPVLGATFRKDRNQYGIPSVRFGVYPLDYMTKKNGKII